MRLVSQSTIGKLPEDSAASSHPAQGGHNLGGVGAAYRVGREIAKRASAPVGILQHAADVVGNIYAEIFPDFRIPQLGQVFGGDLSGKKHALYLVSHHDVQAVGQLVGFGAYERRRAFVDRPVKIGGGDSLKLSGKDLPDFRENKSYKFLASAYYVLKSRDWLSCMPIDTPPASSVPSSSSAMPSSYRAWPPSWITE